MRDAARGSCEPRFGVGSFLMTINKQSFTETEMGDILEDEEGIKGKDYWVTV